MEHWQTLQQCWTTHRFRSQTSVLGSQNGSQNLSIGETNVQNWEPGNNPWRKPWVYECVSICDYVSIWGMPRKLCLLTRGAKLTAEFVSPTFLSRLDGLAASMVSSTAAKREMQQLAKTVLSERWLMDTLTWMREERTLSGKEIQEIFVTPWVLKCTFKKEYPATTCVVGANPYVLRAISHSSTQHKGSCKSGSSILDHGARTEKYTCELEAESNFCAQNDFA